MENTEIEFVKYKSLGAYHWAQISLGLYRSNAFVKARYQKCVELASYNSIKDLKGLDMGCGDGVLSYFLWQKGAKVTGIDKSAIAIKYAKEKHAAYRTDCSFFEGDVYQNQQPDCSLDFVVCSDVIEHVIDPDKLLTEIYRILKPSGFAVISTPIRFTHKPLDTMHVVEWFQPEFKQLVERTFTNTAYHQSHPLFWMEFMNRSKISRVITNLIALVHNPFLFDRHAWRYYALQYAVVVK